MDYRTGEELSLTARLRLRKIRTKGYTKIFFEISGTYRYPLCNLIKAAFDRYKSVGFMKNIPEFIMEIMATYPESMKCYN
jgi:hypothetical protein